MKILYIANDRHAAELAAFALRAVAPDVAIAWAPRLGEARHWIDENPDVATLIVEVESDNPSCESFVSEVHGLGVTVPVIVVVQDSAPPLTALEAVADQIVTKDLSFLNDLPDIVRRTLHPARQAARRRLRLLYVGDAALARLNAAVAATTAARQKLEQQLADREAALRHAEQRAKSEQQTASQNFARRQTELEAALTAEVDQRRTLERKLAQAEASHQSAEQLWLAEAAASADRLTHQHAEFSNIIVQAVQARDALVSKLGNAATTQEGLERRLADADTALRDADARAAAERRAAQQQAAERQAQNDAELAREIANREALEQRLADATLALQSARQGHASEMSDAATRLTVSQEKADARLAEAVAATKALESRLADTAAALTRVEQQATAERQAAAEEAAQRQAEYDAELAREVTNRQALAQAFDAAEAAHQRTEHQHASETAVAAAHLADHRQQAETQMAEAAIATKALESRLADTAAALMRVERQATAERQAAAEEAAQRQAEYDIELARELTNGQTLAKAVSDAEIARQRTEQQHASEMALAAAHLADHRQQAETQLAEAVAATKALEGRVADTAAALTRVEQRATAERQAAAEEAAQRQAEYDAELVREGTNRQALAKALEDAEAARQRAEHQHASEMAVAAAHLADQGQQAETQLAEAIAATKVLESRVADTAAALQTAEQQAAAERQAAAEQAAQCQARFETELRKEVAYRQAVEEEFADTRAASEQVQLGLLDQVAAMRQHEARLEERAARERAEWESTQVEERERIQHLQMEGDLARQSLVATEEQIQRLRAAHEEERANFERARIAIEAELAHQHAEYTALQQTLDRSRMRNQESEEAAAKTLADAEHRLHLTLAAGNRDSLALAQLQEQLKALGEELDTTRGQREVLKAAAGLVPQLHKQIGDIRAENRQRFDNNPVNMCRCRRDGAIARVNHALASMLGYDSPEEMQKVDFAATVFESGDELQWIVDRCLASRSTESVETTWRRKDGTRIIVRVLAVATTADSIDLAVQDITAFRELEEKLRNSQRMEAVARYASEVAVNCDNLLRHVKEEGEQWLARIDSGTARHQGELLLEEVTRAAGFLRQLGAYGNEQKKAPELVEVNKVLRDMEPVLKRVAGSNIELVLPKASTPLNLDVEAERVERMLVNVAAYGRERMPLGGRLMIEVASVVLDRKFVSKYPNVRPGAHVLLTVNEVRGAVRPDFLAAVRTQGSDANATASASDNPGVDLGALQALVSDCGGHLWMMAEPPGDMVLKIHLPRRVLDRPDPGAPAKRPVGTRWINRLPGTWH